MIDILDNLKYYFDEYINKKRIKNQFKKYLNNNSTKDVYDLNDDKVLQAKNKLIKKINKKYNINLEVSDLVIDEIEYLPSRYLNNGKFIEIDYKLTPEQFLNCLEKGIVYFSYDMDEYNRIIGDYEYRKEIYKIYTIKPTPFKYIQLTQKDLKMKGLKFKLINKFAKLDKIGDKEVNFLKEDSLKLIVDEYYLKYMLNDILKNKTLKQRLLKKKYFIHVTHQFTRGYKYINEMVDDIGKNLGVDNLTKQFDFDYVEIE